MASVIDKSALMKLNVEERLRLMDTIWGTLIDQDDKFSPELLAEL